MLLAACLAATSHRMLQAIGHTNGIPASSHIPKQELISRLLAHLLSKQSRLFAEDVTLEQAMAMRYLLEHNGSIEADVFIRVFGTIRPFRPWRSDSPTHPWRQPVSVTEALLYRGLVYCLHNQQIVLPDEFHALAREVSRFDTPTPVPPETTETPQPAVDPIRDLALWLAYLHHDRVTTRSGGWLRKRDLQAIAVWLNPPVACPNARSERAVGRLAFIHYLAEALNLVALIDGRLAPGPLAASWLRSSREEQYRALWDAWLAPSEANRNRWARSQLPGAGLHDPPGFAARLAAVLAAFPYERWFDLETLADRARMAPDELLPGWEDAAETSMEALLDETLAGPLYWLGVVEVQAAPPGVSASHDERFADPDIDETPDDLHLEAPPLSEPGIRIWRLTLLGAWLLGQPVAAPVTSIEPLRVDDTFGIALPACPDYAGVLAVAAWAELLPGTRMQLTDTSIAHAIEQDATLDGLLYTLACYTTPSLSSAQQTTLAGWVAAAAPVMLRPALLLEAVDAAQLNAIWNNRSLRAFLDCRLDQTRASVQTNDLRQLGRLLHRHGYSVRTLAPQQAAGNAALQPGDAFWLAFALDVLAHLSWRLNLAANPPAVVLEHLLALLRPETATAARTAAADVTTQLARALDGPSPLPASLPQEQLIDRLEAAIQMGTTIHIRYWSAGRGEITERQVQPHQIIWYGDHPALVALCHLRHEQRTFRLDRILDLREDAPEHPAIA